MANEPKYIVKKSQILNGVRWALECDIKKSKIVDLLMLNIELSIETILKDYCDEAEDYDDGK